MLCNTHEDVDEDGSDGESDDEQPQRRGVAADVEYVRLSNQIKGGAGHGMSPLRRARRGMQAPNALTHHDVWDRILCAGVPVSLRELVSFVSVQLGLTDNDMHRLLLCRWSLKFTKRWTVLSSITGVAVSPQKPRRTSCEVTGLRSPGLKRFATCPPVVSRGLYVEYRSKASRNISVVHLMKLCTCWLDTLHHIRPVVVNVVRTIDRCVQEG